MPRSKPQILFDKWRIPTFLKGQALNLLLIFVPKSKVLNDSDALNFIFIRHAPFKLFANIFENISLCHLINDRPLSGVGVLMVQQSISDPNPILRKIIFLNLVQYYVDGLYSLLDKLLILTQHSKNPPLRINLNLDILNRHPLNLPISAKLLPSLYGIPHL